MTENRHSFFREAFVRNLGLLSLEDQELLSKKSVGIAGLGGVGGAYALSLARTGVGRMVLSDFDHFELANMNRQAGAMTSTLGKSKVDAVVQMVKDINPHIQIEIFSAGINTENVQSFVEQCDVVIDAIDFYCITTHQILHAKCRELGKHVLFSAPIGCSATLQVFDPRGMSFEDYFDFKSCHDFLEKMAAFALGCAPKATQRSYMTVTGERLAAGAPPSLISAVNLCAGFVTNSTLLLLTGKKREVRCAPFYMQCDARKMKLVSGSLRFGNRGWIQQFKRWAICRKFSDWGEQINKKEK